MDKKITILKRTDKEVFDCGLTPQITILAGGNRKDSGSIAEVVRDYLLQRMESFQIRLTAKDVAQYGSNLKTIPFALIRTACSYKRPFVNSDYDYLRRSVRSVSCNILYDTINTKVDYSIVYSTSATQERAIDETLKKLFVSSDAYSIKPTYKRVKFAYDYIISNVRYDETRSRISAYNALIEKCAVCEGCATLLYRMLSMFGVPCRIITGKGMNEDHAWNIAAIDGLWYNLDVTWDLYKSSIERGLGLYSYFLKGEDDFANHVRIIENQTDDFVVTHPMSKTKYLIPSIWPIS